MGADRVPGDALSPHPRENLAGTFIARRGSFMTTHPRKPPSVRHALCARLEQLDDRIVPAPVVLDPNLTVRTVTSDLITPIGAAFLGANDLLVLEKNTGQIKRVVNGTVTSTVLDLAVNNSSERGLLSMALDPDFPNSPSVYLYWTESTTGADSAVLSETPLLGNRVDRYVWDGSTLTFAQNLIHLRAFQDDATNGRQRGNHNGGVIRFGPDGNLYILIGDEGRRGQTQNLEDGPFGPGIPDDQFGGPEPDSAHLTGVVLRLNTDGTAPADNPFFAVGAAIGGEVGANLQKVFSYGHRNGFGMAFDPVSGSLWESENGDDSFSELNRIEPGMDGGWVRIMGPVSRIAQFKEIETSPQFFGLQQVRWSPTNIADTTEEALASLFVVPGSHYRDPEFSWKFEVAPGGIGFQEGSALGPQYRNDLFMGAATPLLQGGYLFHFNLTGNRLKVGVDDPRLNDRVADNVTKHNIVESESLLFGTGFGIVTDIRTGPNGNLFVVSLSDGKIYEISRIKPRGVKGNPVFLTPTAVSTVVADRGELAQAVFLGPNGPDLASRPIAATLINMTRGVQPTGTAGADGSIGPLAGQDPRVVVEQMLAAKSFANLPTQTDISPPTGRGDPSGREGGAPIGLESPDADSLFAANGGTTVRGLPNLKLLRPGR